MQFAFWLLKYYYSDQVNEIICIEALHKVLCIKFINITKMAYYEAPRYELFHSSVSGICYE